MVPVSGGILVGKGWVDYVRVASSRRARCAKPLLKYTNNKKRANLPTADYGKLKNEIFQHNYEQGMRVYLVGDSGVHGEPPKGGTEQLGEARVRRRKGGRRAVGEQGNLKGARHGPDVLVE